jgi:hypothetical protein
MADTHSESSGRDTKYRGETSTEPNTDDSTTTGANIMEEVTFANNAARTAFKKNKPTDTATPKKSNLVGLAMPAASDDGMSAAGINIKDEVTLANNAAQTTSKENKPTDTATRKKYDLFGISMPTASDDGISVAYTNPANTPMSTAYTNSTNTAAYAAPPRTAGHPYPLPLPRIRTAAELEAAEGLLELFRRG